MFGIITPGESSTYVSGAADTWKPRTWLTEQQAHTYMVHPCVEWGGCWRQPTTLSPPLPLFISLLCSTFFVLNISPCVLSPVSVILCLCMSVSFSSPSPPVSLCVLCRPHPPSRSVLFVLSLSLSVSLFIHLNDKYSGGIVAVSKDMNIQRMRQEQGACRKHKHLFSTPAV